jgi:cob(I)alamin adenosyltransferase
MKIYTRTGDDGTTGLFGGARVGKDDARVEAYGSVDETNSAIGVARAGGLPNEVDAELARIQDELFALGAELACVREKRAKLASDAIDAGAIARLEAVIDRLDADLPPLQNFILPGGAPSAAALHLARTICRRSERRLLAAARLGELRPELLVYLNRLSDLLFVAARSANRWAGVPDVPWNPRQTAAT